MVWAGRVEKGGAPRGPKPRRSGGSKGGRPKRWGAQNFALPVPEDGGAAQDSPKAQTCTFEGPRLLKHHQNSTRKQPEREEKNEFCGGTGRNFGRSRGRAVPELRSWEGWSREGAIPGNLETNTPHGNRETNTHATQHTHIHTQTHSKHKSNSVWPKSVLTKVGHDPPDSPLLDGPSLDRPKFRSFFSLSCRKIRSFVSLLESLRGILVVFMPPGFHNDSPKMKNPTGEKKKARSFGPHPSVPSAIDFGQFRLRPAFFFEFGQFDFGQFLDVEFWDDKVWGPRRVGAPKGGAPKGGGAKI